MVKEAPKISNIPNNLNTSNILYNPTSKFTADNALNINKDRPPFSFASRTHCFASS